jgi:hypothetical protein
MKAPLRIKWEGGRREGGREEVPGAMNVKNKVTVAETDCCRDREAFCCSSKRTGNKRGKEQ